MRANENVFTRTEVATIASFLDIDRGLVESVGYLAWLKRRRTGRKNLSVVGNAS